MPAQLSPRAARRSGSTGRRPVPAWATHPGVGVLVLLALAVALIWRGEPQPSSRPSGTSVGVSGTARANERTPALLLIRDGRLDLLFGSRVIRTLALPDGATARSLVTNRGLTVVLGIVDGRQHAYAVTSKLAVTDLGYADAVLPAVEGTAAMIVESAVTDPGTLPPGAEPSPTASASASGQTGSASPSEAPGETPLRDFEIRRLAGDGHPLAPAERLPDGYRAAADTAVGLTVWQPVNRVFDHGVEQESLSAAALLVRPDGTQRELGSVHPLAADGTQLLVWDVRSRRFGVMPLQYVTSTATSTASPSASASHRTPAKHSLGPTPSPSVVAGTRWFLPTRGMLLVTGPAAFNGDGSAFAVYAQVGSRRRLVVAELGNLGTDQVEVLVLNQPPVKSSAASSNPTLVLPSPSGSRSASAGSGPPAARTPSGSGAAGSGAAGSGASGSVSASPSTSSTAPAVAPDGYPIEAPLAPLWLDDGQVVAVAQDGTVIGYRPGGAQSAALDFGVTGVRAMAPTP
ncbi:MAG TPA: hypothetical protein VMB79_06530 [Jatrophihabitans sp.]|nr:hypothetical protein [Jatrophihabitans sp.]